MRIALLIAAKLAVGAAVLAVVLTRVPLAPVLDAVRHVAPTALLLAIVLFFAAHIVNALKLRVFLPDLGLWPAIRFTLLALLYGAVLPGQLAGDAVKAVRLMRVMQGGNAGHIAAAVALDKVVGLFALLVLTALGLGLEAKAVGADAARIGTAVIVLAAAGVTALVVLPPPAWFGRFGQAFRLWRDAHVSGPVMLTSLALGLVFNALSIAVFVVLGAALGLHLSLAAWAVVVGLISLALLLPITVAGIGLRDAGLVALLAALGQDAQAALALSFLLLALTLIGAVAGFVVEMIGRDRA